MKCCLCGCEILGYGNNPAPLDTTDGARCCDDCDMFVIQARIESILPSKYVKKENKNER